MEASPSVGEEARDADLKHLLWGNQEINLVVMQLLLWL